MGVPADQLVHNGRNDIRKLEFSFLTGYLNVHGRLKQQITELLSKLGGIPGVQRLQNLVGLFEQVVPQGFVGLLPVPRASAWRTEPRHDFLKRLVRSGTAQRRQIKGGGVIEPGQPVELIELHFLDSCRIRSGTGNHEDRMIVGVKRHQGHFDIACENPAVTLRYEQRIFGQHHGEEIPGKHHRVHHLRSIHKIQVQQR